MFLLVIVGLAISATAPASAMRAFSPAWTAAATWGLSIAGFPLGYVLCRAARRGAAGMPVQDRAVRVHRIQLLYHLCLVALFVLSVHVFGWRSLVIRFFGPYDMHILLELLSVAPFLAALVLSWLPGHRMGSILRDSPYPLRHYADFQARGVVVTVLPWFLFLGILDLLVHSRARDFLFVYPFLQWLTAVTFLGALFVCAPLLLRILWAPRALPAGEIRSRLEEFCRRLGFRYRDILVWNTAGGMVNAAVTGVIAPLRYILITDAMLHALDPDEIEAVLAHEIGHVVHMHIPWYAAMTLGYLSFMLSCAEPLWTAAGESMGTVMMLSLFLFYWAVLFGFVSRRLERQADLFSARAIGNAGLVGRTLEEVAVLNGHVQKVFSLRHFSIARRSAFLRRVAFDPAVGRTMERRLAVTLALLGLAVCAGLACAAWTAARQIRDPSDRLAVLARDALLDGEYATARRYARQAVRTSPVSNAVHHALLGESLRLSGDPVRALAEYRIALHLTDASGRLGKDLARAIESLSPKDP